jgi:mono/diheme cytochrome c family protein
MPRRWIILLSISAAALAVGCEDPHNDMGDQPKYRTYEPSAFFPDGASARPLAPGVVPREDDHGEAGLADLSPANASIPFPITADVMRAGGEAFNIYCAVCHGRLGNGDGMIVQRGFTRPPSFHVPRLRSAADAHFYNVITQGYGAMFSYNDRVPPRQRWEIVAYIRALQAAPDAPGATLTAPDRAALIAGGDRKTPTTGGGG